jgi:hypothetical protein
MKDDIVKGGQGRYDGEILDYAALVWFCLYFGAAAIGFARFFA